ncbi:MAG: DNA cytosine methyltransferase [Burkholderiales bacterium]|nr:MAG: DNA cytosine methyltransferase [Burkholderiales bacterium]
MKLSTRPIAIDLFAGAGGLSLGLEQAGFDVAAAVEIDPIHCAVHEYNFPQTKVICKSVTQLTGEKIRELAGLQGIDVDLLAGGAPCQGFSLMGKRALDDPRNQLVQHFVRLVSELQPKYCLFENVKGLTLGKHAKFLDELIAALQEIGYLVQSPYRVLNAADFGVPQSRERLFLIAARAGLALPKYPEPEQRKVTVFDAIADLPDADRFDALLDSDALPLRWTTSSNYAKRLRGQSKDATDFGYSREFEPQQLTSSMRTIHTDLSRTRFKTTPAGTTEPVSRFFKLDLDGLCNTLRAGTDSQRGAFTAPRPIHPTLPRVITVREAARLHSYPDWFRLHMTKWHGFRQIGNSVPPLLARAVGGQIIKALGIKPRRPPQPVQCGNTEHLAFNISEASRYFQVSSKVIPQRNRATAVGIQHSPQGELYA